MGEFADSHEHIWRDHQRSERASKRDAIRERIRQAVAAEREACAKIAEELIATWKRDNVGGGAAIVAAEVIAAKIRNQTP